MSWLSSAVRKVGNTEALAYANPTTSALALYNKLKGNNSSSSSSSSSGGGGGGGSESYSSGATYSLKDLLTYGPQLAEQQWQEQQKYLPLQTQLQLDLAKQYGPQQNDWELSQAKKYTPQYETLLEQLNSSSRGADLADVAKYASSLQGIRESAEMPETTALRKTLLGQINNELQMGSLLTPEQARETEQAQRTADIARGIGGGTGSSAREAVYKALQGQKLLGQRQQKASSALGQEYSASPDPYQAILGRASNAGNATSQYASGMNTPTQAGTPISSQAGLTSVLNYGTNANALGLQSTQYNNMLSYIPQLLSMYNS